MFFSTPINAPLPATTPIYVTNVEKAVVLLSLPIPATLVVGSLLEYDGTITVTDDTGKDVWDGCRIKLGSSPTDTGGFSLSTPYGFGSNATPDIHHKVCHESGRVVLPNQLVNPFLNFVMTNAWDNPARNYALGKPKPMGRGLDVRISSILASNIIARVKGWMACLIGDFGNGSPTFVLRLPRSFWRPMQQSRGRPGC